MADLEGWPLFLNEAGQRLVGPERHGEVRALHIADFFAPEERADRSRRAAAAVLGTGARRGSWTSSTSSTGERIPVSWDAFRIDDPDTGGAGRDGDDHPGPARAAARAGGDRGLPPADRHGLRQHHRRVLRARRDFRFSYINDRAVQVLGDVLGEPLGREDFLGNEVFAMFPGVVGTDAERNFRLALAERRTIAYEYLYPPRARWFDIRVYPADEGLAVYFVEISDRKAAEALRRRQTRQQAAVASSASARRAVEMPSR